MALKEVDNYYTVAQARKVLGVNNDTLYSYVENGALKRVIPPGKKQGLYRRTEVDQLARELQAFIAQRKTMPTQCTRVTTREEMSECMEISQALFGVGIGVLDTCTQLLETPYVCYALKANDQIIGFTGIMPLKPGKLNSVLAQTLPIKVPPEDMETLETDGKTIDIYIDVMAVKPGFAVAEKHVYGSRLIAKLVEIIVEYGKKGIVINTIAARSNTADGIRLLRHIGFTEIERATPERRTFIINVKESGMPFVEYYKQALKKSSIPEAKVPTN
jgi:hypothetical protein